MDSDTGSSKKTRVAHPAGDLLQDYLDSLLMAATLTGAPKETAPKPSRGNTTRQNGIIWVDGEVQGWDMEPNPAERSLDIDSPVVEATPPVSTSEINSSECLKEPLRSAGTLKNYTLLNQISALNCMIFSIAGVRFAVPLEFLGGVYRFTKVSRLSGQADWCLGLWHGMDKQLKVIDSAIYFMSERKSSVDWTDQHFILQLDDSGWALTCELISETALISNQDVSWKKEGSPICWKAGTIVSEVCTLLDVQGLLTELPA